MLSRLSAAVLAAGLILAPLPSFAIEGMFPVSELAGMDLSRYGLEVGADEIYSPGQLGLVDGICKVGGCTGSFVSDRGLILTNHHCAFRAIQNASHDEADYLTDGFLARRFEEEVPAKGYTVRITESYRDVSSEVLAVLTGDMSALDRTRAIERRRKELEIEAEAAHPGKRAEVAEMFQGKTYVLFLYTWLKDVRLVHAPPRAIGEFGGEDDNWIWPRHTGDYSFLRAYVGPDGEPAEHSPDNVPYRPRQVLRISPKGANEGDAVFLFGYPARTYRHRTSHFLDFESRIRMPQTVEWYGWQIDLMERRRAEDETARLKLSARVNGLSNVHKNYRGKLQGIQRLDLVQRRQQAEAQLQAFIEAEPGRAQEYGGLLAGIDQVYRAMTTEAPLDFWLDQLKGSSHMLGFAFAVCDAAHERAKPEVDREPQYQDRNWSQTTKRLEIRAENFDAVTERALLVELLRRGGEVDEARDLPSIGVLLGKENATVAKAFVDQSFATSRIQEVPVLHELLTSDPDALAARADPFVDLMLALYPTYLQMREQDKKHKGELDALHAELVDAQMQFLGEAFLPDANGTLRLTLGRVRGYSPRDGVTYRPQTTLRGVLEKSQHGGSYAVPERLIELARARDFGRYGHEELGELPVCLLYSADTSGGNSGSPIFDAEGRLVGVNFDRAWEATINDYAWDDSYSRSIGVDIRYVLWLTQKYGGADHLLEEMGLRGNM